MCLSKTCSGLGGYEGFGVIERRERAVERAGAAEGVGEKGVRVHAVVVVHRAGDEIGIRVRDEESGKCVKGLVRVENEAT